MRNEFAKLLKLIKKNVPSANVDVIRKAYRMADRAHAGQHRLSGEPFITHPLAVARNLASLKLDVTTIAAGLLHDVIEDTSVTREDIRREFGDVMAMLIEGVTKMAGLSRTPSAVSDAQKQAASIQKMLIATVRDVRVLIIKIADRLHNMETIESLAPDRIRDVSRETLDIYAPLAHRLGIARWKWELEDHAFHRLNPVEYKEIARRVAMKRREREAWVEQIKTLLGTTLAGLGISTLIEGRPKHLYSIYQKMLRQGKDFDEVRDIQGVRIVTEKEAECYEVLGVVHGLWTPISGRFKDYIAMQKINGYQSIHTTVMCEGGRPLEIQIRTREMDRTANIGIAAHWRYKEGQIEPDHQGDNRLVWLRQMYDWIKEASSLDDEFMDDLKRDIAVSEIFVFTPKSEVKELPRGATPLDFAYSIHSDIGDHCMGAKVNGRMVQLGFPLRTGDTVDILTSKNQTPHRDWLNMVVTARARNKIRQRLRELGEIEAVEEVKEKARHPGPALHAPKTVIREVDDATREQLIRIEGAKGVAVQFAKCCKPMPGHEIVGYSTMNAGITVHRVDCGTFNRGSRDPKRLIETSWVGDQFVETALRVLTRTRTGMLADITNAISPLNITIREAQFKSEGERGQFDVVFDAPDRDIVGRVMRIIRTLGGVTEVTSRYMRVKSTASR